MVTLKYNNNVGIFKDIKWKLNSFYNFKQLFIQIAILKNHRNFEHKRAKA